MDLNEFLEDIKSPEKVKLFSEQSKSMALPSSIHKKIKQIAFQYNVPQSILVGGILNQWIEDNKERIITDRIESIKNDF